MSKITRLEREASGHMNWVHQLKWSILTKGGELVELWNRNQFVPNTECGQFHQIKGDKIRTHRFNPCQCTHKIFHLWIPEHESVTQLTKGRGKSFAIVSERQ